MSHLQTAVSPKTIRVIYDLTFDLSEKNRRGGVNARTSADGPPPYLCAQALPSLLREPIALRQCYPERRILLSKIIFYNGFRTVRVNPDRPQFFEYAFHKFIVVELRLKFGRTPSPAL